MNFRDAIAHFSSLLSQPAEFVPENRVFVSDADFGRKLGLSRLGLHYVILPPHCRSSLPHAESHEEEFIFVLSGQPHLWLDGHLFQMRERDCVAFASGTGVSHTIINNSDREVHLFVAGERTKAENRCVFPLDPEMHEISGIGWRDAPKRERGPHEGWPERYATATSRGSQSPEPPPQLRPLASIDVQPSFSYTDSAETFSEGRRIGRDLGLQRLGLWFEQLPPGKRTSWPHAHLKEEEFVFVLSGQPQVWLNGITVDLKPGDGVAFPAGTGLAHTILNPGSEPSELIVCGESTIENDRIFYPLHPERNAECRREGSLWENPPTPVMTDKSK